MFDQAVNNFINIGPREIVQKLLTDERYIICDVTSLMTLKLYLFLRALSLIDENECKNVGPIGSFCNIEVRYNKTIID